MMEVVSIWPFSAWPKWIVPEMSMFPGLTVVLSDQGDSLIFLRIPVILFFLGPLPLVDYRYPVLTEHYTLYRRGRIKNSKNR